MEPNGRVARHAHMNDQPAPHPTSVSRLSTFRPRGALVAVGTLTVLALVLASCRTAGGAGSGGDTPSGGGGAGGDDRAAGDGGQLVLRIESAGGFVPREFALSSVPELSILADGRVITHGPQIAIYPGPALPNLQERRLTEAGLQEVIRTVTESGHLSESAEFTGAFNYIADAHTTYFTFVNEGRSVAVSVYALGIVDPQSAEMLPADDRAAHAALQPLRDRLMSLETWLPETAWADAEWRAFVPGALRVYVRVPTAEEEAVDDVEPERREWPLATPLAEFGEQREDSPDLRCAVATGADANRLLEAFAPANGLTRWQSGGAEYAVIVRPLLPDEAPECP